VPDVKDSDLHHPMNHVGYERFRKWLKSQTKIDYKIMDAKRQDKKVLFKQKDHFANFEEEEEMGQPIEQKTFDINNILLSLNYFTGFGATIIEASKKIDAEDEEEEKHEGSRKDSDEDADLKPSLDGSDEEDENKN